MKFIYNRKSLKSGIYKIVNTTNHRIYIGSAKEFKSRGRDHLKSLRNNKHHNKFLQHDFNKCGEDVFEFHVLEVVEGAQSDRLLVEQKHLDKFYDNQKECYNFKPHANAKSRSCFSNTPEKTSKLISDNSKTMWTNPKHRKLMSHKAKERWKNPDYREKCLENLKGPSEAGKRNLSDLMKQKWQDPEFKARMSKKISETLISKMKNDTEFREKTLNNLSKPYKN